jgi:FtsH-binding integral membrane protein
MMSNFTIIPTTTTKMSSYQPIPGDSPPAYSNSQETPRVDGDNIPDDFKYSVNVASCELPIRQMFVRKVYALLTLQVLGTVVVGYIIRSNSAIQEWCLNNMWLYIVSIIGVIGFAVGALIKAKSYPSNVLFLAGFTLCEAYGIGLLCSLVETDLVIQALLLTLVIFIGLTLFSFQTSYDFVQWQGMASMGLWILIGWGLVMMFFPPSSTVNMVYSGLGALLFSVYIVIDTQKLMKTLFLDDEIICTIQLYLDIVNLFFFILRMLQSRNDN